MAANKIDSLNAVTHRYMLEVKEGLKAAEKDNKKKRRKKDDIISFTDGNETVMMPNNGSKCADDCARDIQAVFQYLYSDSVCEYFFLDFGYGGWTW